MSSGSKALQYNRTPLQFFYFILYYSQSVTGDNNDVGIKHFAKKNGPIIFPRVLTN